MQRFLTLDWVSINKYAKKQSVSVNTYNKIVIAGRFLGQYNVQNNYTHSLPFVSLAL